MSKRLDTPWRSFAERNAFLLICLLAIAATFGGIALMVTMAFYLPWWAYFGLWVLLMAWGGHRFDLKRRSAHE